MRVAFASMEHPDSRIAWSGTTWRMRQALANTENCVVVPIGPLAGVKESVFRSAAKGRSALSAKVYKLDRNPLLLKGYADSIARELERQGPFDLLVSPSTVPISLLDVSTPAVVWTDAVIPLMLNYYPEFSSWSAGSIRTATAMERLSLERTSMFVGSSAWARRGAEALIGGSNAATKCGDVMFGANLDAAAAFRAKPCVPVSPKLLLVGVDWRRKGVDVAIDATRTLRRSGVDASLDVVGCLPPRGTEVPDYVNVWGYLSKSTSQGRELLMKLFTSATIYIMASSAECTPIVLCEAAAMGLPAVASSTGGVGSVVAPGKSGLLVEDFTSGAGFADAVLSVLSSNASYSAFQEGAVDEYWTRLNWRSAAAALFDGVEKMGLV